MEKVTIEKPDQQFKEKLKIDQWPLWTKEESMFDWYYDETEQCLILEGIIEVEAEGEKYSIVAGDFVTFQKGLSCKWIVKSPVRKHYRFI